MTRAELLELARIFHHKNFGHIQMDARGTHRRIPWDTAHDELLDAALALINERDHSKEITHELMGAHP